MIVIGLTGGIACGKSTVAKQFQCLGALLLDADQVGHDVLLQQDIKDQIRLAFGFAEDEIFSASGDVQRTALAKIVFNPSKPSHLQKLESITHPIIRKKLEQQIESARSHYPATVLDAPVMFKTGWENFCDLIIYINTPLEVRLHRARSRNWPAGELQRREAMQTELKEKRSKSDFVISNDSSIQVTLNQVNKIWKTLFPSDKIL